MKVAIKERGETGFQSPANESKGLKAGDRWTSDYVWKFTNADLKRIEAARKAAGVESFFNELANRALSGTIDFELMDLYLSNGLKGPDGNPVVINDGDLDGIPVHDVQEQIFDAVCRALKGKTAEEYVKEMMEVAANSVEGPTIPQDGGS